LRYIIDPQRQIKKENNDAIWLDTLHPYIPPFVCVCMSEWVRERENKSVALYFLHSISSFSLSLSLSLFKAWMYTYTILSENILRISNNVNRPIVIKVIHHLLSSSTCFIKICYLRKDNFRIKKIISSIIICEIMWNINWNKNLLMYERNCITVFVTDLFALMVLFALTFSFLGDFR